MSLPEFHAVMRRLDPRPAAIFKDIVFGAAVAPTMERFDDLLTEADVEAIHAYLIDESWSLRGRRSPRAASH